MASNEELVLMAMLLLEEDDDDDDKEHRCAWSRTWLLQRKYKGHYSQLLSNLAAHDTPGFQILCRWILNSLKIVDTLSESLYKKDTVMRESIKPAEMCCLGLRYLVLRMRCIPENRIISIKFQ